MELWQIFNNDTRHQSRLNHENFNRFTIDFFHREKKSTWNVNLVACIQFSINQIINFDYIILLKLKFLNDILSTDQTPSFVTVIQLL